MRYRHFTCLVVALFVGSAATRSPAAPPAPPLPTPEQIDTLFADGDYPQALRQIGLALSARGDMAALYDRHDLLVLKGETHLRLKNPAAAADAFDEAARWTKDETKASVDRATAELFRRSKAGKYVPAAKKGEPAPQPIDVIDPAARKAAFAALFEQTRPRVAAAAKAARQSNKLPVMYQALVTVRDLQALEVAATGEHFASAEIAADLGSRAVALMGRAVAERERTVTALEQSSAQVVQDVVFAGGRAEPVASGPRGLTRDETRRLRQIADDCGRVGRLAGDLRKMYEPGPDEADALRKLRDDADAVATRARELANVDWNLYYRDDGMVNPDTLTQIRGHDPDNPNARPRGGTTSVQRPARRGNPTAGPRGVNTGGPR